MAHHAVKGHSRNGRKPNGHHEVELLPRGHIQHDDEHGEQYQGEAEILLQHDDDEGERPHDDEREQGARLGSHSGPTFHVNTESISRLAAR